MRGHEQLIAMRRQGWMPMRVYIDTEVDPAQSWSTWPELDEATAQVEIPPEDSLSSLDLRFVIGMSVVITGRCRRRVEMLRELCIEAGATRVISTVFSEHGSDEVLDTAGFIKSPAHITP